MNRIATLAGVALLAALPAGCGPGAPTVGYNPDIQGRLEEVGAMYRAYVAARKAAPRRMADLEPFEPANQYGYMALRDGEVILFWGGSAPGANSASVVLAHEKKVPAEGGLVLMQDGTVKTMTAEQFKAAPRAGR